MTDQVALCYMLEPLSIRQYEAIELVRSQFEISNLRFQIHARKNLFGADNQQETISSNLMKFEILNLEFQIKFDIDGLLRD